MKSSTEAAVAFSWKRPGLLPPRPHGERVPEGRVRRRDLVGSSKSDEPFWSERTAFCGYPDRPGCTTLREFNGRDVSMVQVQVTVLGGTGRRVDPIVAFRSAKERLFAERKATISNSCSCYPQSKWSEPLLVAPFCLSASSDFPLRQALDQNCAGVAEWQTLRT
jgi:hypothetical protein